MLTYEVDVNFDCVFSFSEINFMNISIPISYEVAPILHSTFIDFIISSIGGVPKFSMKTGYDIKNMDLALFMVDQTINMAKNLIKKLTEGSIVLY